METSARIRRTSEIDDLYELTEHFDDVKPQGEEDHFETEGEEDNIETEGEEDNVETESEEDNVEIQVSDESGNEETRQGQVSIDENDEPLNKKPKDRDSLCGTNGYKWSRIPEQCDGQSKTTYVAAPKGPALNVKTPLEAWNLFFDDEILNCILIHTNKAIESERAQMKEDVARKSYYKNVEILEVKAVIGIFYFAGLMKARDIDTRELWSPLSSSIFRMTMSEKRFTFILSCLRFDDKNTCLEKEATDLAPIRQIWDKFINNCTSNYEPHSHCTIGEQFLSFWGECIFRMRIPKISVKRYGLKIITMNDATTHYLFNAIPYCGIIKDKIETESESSYYIRKLTEPIYDTERNITCDSWFISIPICKKMLKLYNITMVGKVDKNAREIPLEFIRKPANGAKEQFAYNNKKVLVSYTDTKSNKIELLLASYHNIEEIHDATGKSKIVLFYNNTKDGTDSFDKKCRDFSVARKTKRWVLRFFYGMLDQANVNSFIIYNLLENNEKKYRREFIIDLSMALIKPLLAPRLKTGQLPVVTHIQIHSFLNKDVPKNQDSQFLLGENKMDKYKRCKYCPNALNRYTLFKCLLCKHPMCKEHTAKICSNCSIKLYNK